MSRCAFVVTLLSLGVSGFRADPPLALADGPVELSWGAVARIGLSASALVVGDWNGEGSAFCVRPDGLFVTNHHVIKAIEELPFYVRDNKLVAPDGSVKLILSSSRDDQKVLKAKLLWSDAGADLALLQAEGVTGLPTLSLETDADLAGVRDVAAFGFPLGSALAVKAQQYPSVNVNKGTIRALRKVNGELAVIEADISVNPGNSGGPLLDRKGRVVGVVFARVERPRQPGYTLAVPLNRLEWFLSRPRIAFEPPPVLRANKGRPVEFKAELTSLFPPRTPLTVELVLGGQGGGGRHVPMKLVDGAYRAVAVPFPEGKLPPGVEVKVDRDSADSDTIRCTVVASRSGQDVSRKEALLFVEDADQPTLKAVSEGRFIRPHRTETPVTSFRMIIPPGNPLGESPNTNPNMAASVRRQLVGGEWQFQGGDRVFEMVSTCFCAPNMTFGNVVRDGFGFFLPTGWTVGFKAADGQGVGVGEHEAGVYKDSRNPLSNVQVVSRVGLSPQILRNYSGRVRIVRGSPGDGIPTLTYLECSGRFRVWECAEGRLAVDFVLWGKAEKPGEPDPPPVAGMFRCRSTYK